MESPFFPVHKSSTFQAFFFFLIWQIQSINKLVTLTFEIHPESNHFWTHHPGLKTCRLRQLPKSLPASIITLYLNVHIPARIKHFRLCYTSVQNHPVTSSLYILTMLIRPYVIWPQLCVWPFSSSNIISAPASGLALTLLQPGVHLLQILTQLALPLYPVFLQMQPYQRNLPWSPCIKQDSLYPITNPPTFSSWYLSLDIYVHLSFFIRMWTPWGWALCYIPNAKPTDWINLSKSGKSLSPGIYLLHCFSWFLHHILSWISLKCPLNSPRGS